MAWRALPLLPLRMSNTRSPEAQQWRRLYFHARWKRIRRWVLAEHPLCQRCEAQGRVTPATDVHHNPPHGGDLDRFWGGPFEALCKPCHDGPAKREELGLPARDYSTEIGRDGFPIDPRHPANRGGHAGGGGQPSDIALGWQPPGSRKFNYLK